MQIAALSDIHIPPNRQRQEFLAEDLIDTAQSIKSKGLLHPIVVRISEDGKKILVAGERRFRCVNLISAEGESFRCNGETIPPGHIPFTLLTDLSDLDMEEAELDENIKRVDLTWQEKATAMRRLYDLRLRQAAAANLAPPTAHDLYKETLNTSIHPNDTSVQQSLTVANNLFHPEVAKAKTAKEALKIVRRMEERERNAELAAVVGKTFSSADHILLNEDSLVWMMSCPDGRFDVILTDPPYGMGADEFGDAGGALAAHTHEYSDDYDSWGRIMSVFCPQSYRICKPEAHLYVFCDFDRFHELKGMMETAGWKVHRTPIVWNKKQAHRVPWPEHGPRRTYEIILYAIKGSRRVNHIALDLVDVPQEENLGHPAQKPAALFQNLLSRSVQAGNSVLDPFCGTGPILPAAHALKTSAVAIEMDPSSYGIAVQRLEKLR